jgi:hypothetical protein
MTEEYTKVQLSRQDDLTRRIQERLASAGEQTKAPSVPVQELADVDMKSTLVQ